MRHLISTAVLLFLLGTVGHANDEVDYLAELKALSNKGSIESSPRALDYLKSLTKDQMLTVLRQFGEEVEMERPVDSWPELGLSVDILMTYYEEPSGKFTDEAFDKLVAGITSRNEGDFFRYALVSLSSKDPLDLDEERNERLLGAYLSVLFGRKEPAVVRKACGFAATMSLCDAYGRIVHADEAVRDLRRTGPPARWAKLQSLLDSGEIKLSGATIEKLAPLHRRIREFRKRLVSLRDDDREPQGLRDEVAKYATWIGRLPLVDVEEDSAPMMRAPAASTPAPIPVEQEALAKELWSGDRLVRKAAALRIEQLSKEELIRLAQSAVDDKEFRESGAIYVSSRLLDIATEKGLGFKEAMALLDAPGSSQYFKVAILDWLYERRIAADVSPPDLVGFLARSDQRFGNRQEELDVRLAAHRLSRGLGSRLLNELNESAKTGVKLPWHAKASQAIQTHVGYVCAIVADSAESDKAVESFAVYLPYYRRVYANRGLIVESTLKASLDKALENTKRSEKCRQKLQAARAKL